MLGPPSSVRWKQVRSPVWQAGPAGSTSASTRVGVAVVAQRAHALHVARRRALVPQLSAGAAPEVDFPGLDGAVERRAVHVGERQHLAGSPVLGDTRNEAVLVERDVLAGHRRVGLHSRQFYGAGLGPPAGGRRCFPAATAPRRRRVSESRRAPHARSTSRLVLGRRYLEQRVGRVVLGEDLADLGAAVVTYEHVPDLTVLMRVEDRAPSGSRRACTENACP